MDGQMLAALTRRHESANVRIIRGGGEGGEGIGIYTFYHNESDVRLPPGEKRFHERRTKFISVK